MGNSAGTYRTTFQNAMKAFDKLPTSIRDALANAHHNYAVQPFLTQWRRGVRAADLVKEIHKSDRRRST
jgi:alpha-ketoglutarate-dependent taurine dioxygenase